MPHIEFRLVCLRESDMNATVIATAHAFGIDRKQATSLLVANFGDGTVVKVTLPQFAMFIVERVAQGVKNNGIQCLHPKCLPDPPESPIVDLRK